MIQMSRRGLLKAALPLIAAPAIIRAAQLMPISVEREPFREFIVYDFQPMTFGHGQSMAMVNPFTGQWEHFGLAAGKSYTVQLSRHGAVVRERA